MKTTSYQVIFSPWCFKSKIELDSLIFKWAIIQESCVITRKPLLINLFISQGVLNENLSLANL